MRQVHTIPTVKSALAGITLLIACGVYAQPRDEVLEYLKSLGHGTYMFGQVGTWMHNENPDMEAEGNWINNVHKRTGILPRYGCITYDFEDNPFTDAQWNAGVKKMWDAGMIVGVYNWYANPSGRAWNEPVDIPQIFQPGDRPTKVNFYRQMDRMATNMKWLEAQGIPVIYTPFVELNDSHKWHAKGGRDNAIKLYRLVHDYFTKDKGLKNIIWAYHTTQGAGALPDYYPGDEYVDVIGKSAYGSGLIFTEYDWAVDKKKNKGKVIWWAELGIRSKSDPPRDCMDVIKKLDESFPELAGFVFWSDEGFYNVVGNLNGKELMESPEVVTAK